MMSDGAAIDYFGGSVSISGTTAIVGAPYDDDNGSISGSAYVFENTGSAWSQVCKLTASDGTEVDRFGKSVSISAATAIVGAWGDDGDRGSAYIFANSGSGWTEMAKLTASDSAAGDVFATTVSISGKLAVVGASRSDDSGTDSGSVYIFQESGSDWPQVAKLLPSDGTAQDNFGESVSVSGNTAIIGAWIDDDGGNDSGSAYIFGPNPGDMNADGQVDYDDLPLFSSAFGHSCGEDGYDPTADLNDDCVIDFWDLPTLSALFGTSY